MGLARVVILIFVGVATLPGTVLAKAPCAPFRVFRNAPVPPEPQIKIPAKLPPGWEENVLDGISKIKTQENFGHVYKIAEQNDTRTEAERYAYLQCVLYYVSQDTNKNGIPDWNAIIDNKPAEVLYPGDPDIDGDGVPNVLDPNPLNAAVHGKKLPPGVIPAHLKIDEKTDHQAARLQNDLYTRYGILAINHTDDHSPAVLRQLEILLERGFPERAVKNLKNFKYIYAFAGHDSRENIAAFHLEAKALSIGGVESYGRGELSPEQKTDLTVALAHEIGHAFLFQELTPQELVDMASTFGGWNFQRVKLKDAFFSVSLFSQHPLRWLADQVRRIPIKDEKFISGSLWKNDNIVSQYATTNVHEWFADAFAAATLQRLGSAGALGAGKWSERLVKFPGRHSRSFWVNYNNVTLEFQNWLKGKLSRLATAYDRPWPRVWP